MFRNRVWEIGDQKSIAAAVEELVEADNGIEFTMETSWLPEGRYAHVLRVAQVRLGRLTDVVLEYGRNMTDYQAPRDIGRLANVSDYFGSIEGSSDTLRRTASVSWDAPRLEAIVSRRDITSASTLQDMANRDRRKRSKPLTEMTLTCLAGPDPAVGEVREGDTLRVKIDDGWKPIDGYFRVMAWGMQGGDEPKLLFKVRDESQVTE